MSVEVIIWDNEGVKTTKPVENSAAAKVHAKMARSLSNRTVKIADAGGTTYHWSRNLSATKNHWVARPVANEFFH